MFFNSHLLFNALMSAKVAHGKMIRGGGILEPKNGA